MKPPAFLTAVPLALSLGFVSLPASALCWIDAEHPKTADNLATSDPRVAPMRQLAQRVHAIVKGNADMQSLQDTRVRSRWQISGAVGGPARALWYQARDHRRDVWAGECGVIDGADRLPARASIVVQINATSDLFNGPPEFEDEGLRAWKMPPTVGMVQGRPLYHGWQIVMTKTGQPPWMPVSWAEFIDFAEREIARQQASSGGNNPFWKQQLDALRAYCAKLSPAELAAQARNGWPWQHPGVPLERWPLLVKLDPAFPWDRTQPQQAQIIALSIQGAPPHAETMQRVMQSLDLNAFEGLLGKR
ncbi:MAG: hypothetical protein REI94_14525 [Moraxellaceae bacterium]|nr:hypothetical protein [Moraxellaceae bacterium]